MIGSHRPQLALPVRRVYGENAAIFAVPDKKKGDTKAAT